MRRSVLALAPLLLLAGGCGPDLDIVRDSTFRGHVKVRNFHVARGVVVTVPSDFVVESAGPAVVEGFIRGEVGSGASIEIRVSTGDLIVLGGLQAGSGADGEEPGADGGPGGRVLLRADRGVIRARGPLEAGAGGDGAGRREEGRGELRVVSGAGGSGGDVSLAAPSVLIDSGAAAGDGGDGGAAWARCVALAPGAPNLVDSGADAPERTGADEPPAPTGVASATAGAGGAGGSVRVSGGALRIDGPLRAGTGGSVARASARGGNAASAALSKPGTGGDVSVRSEGLTEPASSWTLIPGDGGDAGLPADIMAEASARTAASASTRGGGDPGSVLVGAKTIAAGEGGDGGGVLAQSDAKARYGLGAPGQGSAPGQPVSKQAP
ncbi:MAG TPA: hypothetical protein VN915_16140 [Elusimicrobiota bacterium]|nr:hypothetical protein [Elusimicrobiota bacterium]